MAVMTYLLCIFCLSFFITNSNCERPKLSPVLNQRTQSENTIFQFYCSVLSGSEPLFFEWAKNGQSVKPNPDVKYRIENSEISSTLTISKAIQSDQGNYTCSVKNEHGSDAQNVLLTIKGKFKKFYSEFGSIDGAIEAIIRSKNSHNIESFKCR